MISSRSAYGKTISCDYGGAALASAGGASAGGQEGFVASGEVEDRSGKLDFAGQFGVGFYSAFIVADRVTLTTRRAGRR